MLNSLDGSEVRSTINENTVNSAYSGHFGPNIV